MGMGFGGAQFIVLKRCGFKAKSSETLFIPLLDSACSPLVQPPSKQTLCCHIKPLHHDCFTRLPPKRSPSCTYHGNAKYLGYYLAWAARRNEIEGKTQ